MTGWREDSEVRAQAAERYADHGPSTAPGLIWDREGRLVVCLKGQAVVAEVFGGPIEIRDASPR